MDNAEILSLVRADLEQPTHAVDEFLAHLIGVARNKIDEHGIKTFDDDCPGDCGLLVMYTSYLYRKRKATTPEESEMPRMLKYSIHNRVMAEKGKVGET